MVIRCVAEFDAEFRSFVGKEASFVRLHKESIYIIDRYRSYEIICERKNEQN